MAAPAPASAPAPAPAPALAPAPAPAKRPPFHRRHRKKLIALAIVLLLPIILHFGIVLATRMSPPPLASAPAGEVVVDGDIRRFGPGYAHKRGKVLEVRLAGAPEQIGHQHSKLLYDEMVQSEQQLYTTLEKLVPFAPARWLIFDVARLIHRGADHTMSRERLAEIAAQARAFSPDPFEGYFPTYQRLVYLNSLYDIALGFEHSPMMGCSSFVATGSATRGAHTILARNFDFEVGPVYDEGKVVFLVQEDGKIPFASVAWPGLIGVLSGMNARGLGVVVHGGRARDTTAEGEPVVHTTRALLAEASTVDEAISMLEKRSPMVSHLLLLVDATGASAVIERAPGVPLFVRRADGDLLPVTNHFEGPLAADPKNLSVRQNTSTLPRRERLDELLAGGEPIDTKRAIDILRDKRGVGGVELPLGHRSTLDAVIATHAVVMDATDRVLWVSEGPHLMGRFIGFDLKVLLDPAYDPANDNAPILELPADAASADEYKRWLDAGAQHKGAE